MTPRLALRSFRILAPLEGFPGGLSGKEPACQCRRRQRCWFDPWVALPASACLCLSSPALPGPPGPPGLSPGLLCLHRKLYFAQSHKPPFHGRVCVAPPGCLLSSSPDGPTKGFFYVPSEKGMCREAAVGPREAGPGLSVQLCLPLQHPRPASPPPSASTPA